MTWVVAPLSEQHLDELALATDRALVQWAKGVEVPAHVVHALERVLLFLRQNGGAAKQAHHVASLAFAFGAQLVREAGWAWRSVSDDGTVNPAVVSPDGVRALLVVDVMTRLVVGADRGSLAGLFRALVAGEAHPLAVVTA